MPSPFLSSEEYDERAHQLYNEGNYDDALVMLREGLGLYPNAVELHVGVGYARLARDEFAWARKSFEEALVLDPEHEDALAGLGETLLRFGQTPQALKAFNRILELGYADDIELMLQVGRALFRDGLIAEAKEFFEVAVQQTPENAEAVSMVGYAQHRLGEDTAAEETLKRALQLDPDHSEARIYLGNLLYDREEFEAALFHLDRTKPEDHWDELGIWRLMELKKSHLRMKDDDPSLGIWEERLTELTPPVDPLEEMLAEIETRASESAQEEARTQLELFGAMLADLTDQKQAPPDLHRVVSRDGRRFDGTWEEIVGQMRDASPGAKDRTLEEFMQAEARRGFAITGILIPTRDAESFLRASADAGLLRIVHLIAFRDVGKTYRALIGAPVRAVDGVTLDVAAGEIVGIAGPNGAGKSTLIAMLLGFLPADQGTVRVDGIEARDFIEREGVSYLPELMTIPPHWTVESALDRLAVLNGIVPAEQLAARELVIEATGIGEHRRKRLKALSKGNLQRLGLAQALLVDRRVVVFDEPTHGLDPVWTARFRELVAGLRQADRAILIASHNLDELERLCDRVAIVDKGRIQRIVDVREAAGASGATRRWRLRGQAGVAALAAQFAGAVVSGDTVECEADLPGLNRGIAAAIAHGALVSSVSPAESSLEEAFRTAVAR